jgi:hypothetical protein
MEQSPRSGVDSLEPRAVLEQLERVLTSSLFRNSKRYPAMLRYVVERTLDGKTRDLKERTVAVEVFGRALEYDPSTDPVVRISAAEVRRRLAQYYQEPAHAEEIRIDLPVGSYVPEFQLAAPRLPCVPPEVPAPAPVFRPWRARRWSLPVAVTSGLVAVAVAWTIWRGMPSELDSFWAPVVVPGSDILVCVGAAGVPARSADTDSAGGSRRGRITWPDTLTMARLTGFLQAKGVAVQFCREDQATFSDFQLSPAVLIGGLNDEWALRLMESMRFQFRREGSVFWIADRDHPESRDWRIEVPDISDGERLPLKRDYAVVSRVHNARTGRITITVAGLWGTGTIAGGKFLTDPAYLRDAARRLPSGWQRRNLQFVLGTEVIEGNPGPPQVLSSAVW